MNKTSYETSDDSLYKTTYHVEKMDCPSEEQMIGLTLNPLDSVKGFSVDLAYRTLHVIHSGEAEVITKALSGLNLDARLKNTDIATEESKNAETAQKRILCWVLVINASFFVLELGFGLVSGSMGLIADSLDMLADAIVYALSLIAIGTVMATKKKVAKFSGLFQMFLALLGFSEVLRRVFLSEAPPDFVLMITVSAFAMIANVFCLWLIQKTRNTEAHMQASLIFTSNDIIVNGGVIVAGLLTYLLNSPFPDLVVGGIVFGFVMRGAVRILNLSK
jgi:Co/Zn/Cd efflux system component